MRAAVLNAFGSALTVGDLPDPELDSGSIIVDVAAAGVAGYAAAVFNGSREYPLDLPVAPGPGGIGRIRAVGSDAIRLSVGDWVYCDPTVRARDDASNGAAILQGWTYRSEAARPLHRLYHHGAFAEQMRVPTENVTAIGDIDVADAGRWAVIGRLLVPFGGLLAGDLQAGETIVVNGATGGFGSAAVAVAVAMGAGTVVATGRNAGALDDLRRRFGARVRTARMAGVEDEDRRQIMEVAGAPIDFVLDFLPRQASPSQVQAAMFAVREGGRVVLMGGVRGSGGVDLARIYNWLKNGTSLRGAWMYPRDAIPRMVRMIRAGLIDLSRYHVTEFGLSEVNTALAHAAVNAGPVGLTVLRPDRA